MISRKNRIFVAIFLLLSIAVSFNRAFDAENDVVFRLYTREASDSFTRLSASDANSISASAFDAKRPTRIFIHGYKSKEKVIIRYKTAFLQKGDYNFISVDWISGAATYNYLSAKGYVPLIASKLASLLSKLGNYHGLRLPDVTIVGHSLGAHIAGRTAKLLQSKDKIGCIIGLDPAGVSFDYFNTESRLDKSDAEYVQVIHTDGDKFGMIEPIGHADFYPNEGKDQPGCPKVNLFLNWMEKCSHVRAHDLFLESLSTEFNAIRCTSMQKGFCTSDGTIGMMGGDISKDTPKPTGIFYLETKTEAPYVIPDPVDFNKNGFFDFCMWVCKKFLQRRQNEVDAS